jgi:hypothetical protein
MRHIRRDLEEAEDAPVIQEVTGIGNLYLSMENGLFAVLLVFWRIYLLF